MSEKLKKIIKAVVKFFAIIIGLFVILIVGVLFIGSLLEYTVYKLEFSHKMSYEEYNAISDCVEFGVCKDGLEINDDGEKIIITKEYCLKKNYEWIEKSNACYKR